MDQQNIFSEGSKNPNIKINLDEFDISEDSFKPVTKGLGFHHENKKLNSFKSTPKETKSVLTKNNKISTHSLLNEISTANKKVATKSVPSGLEAFYGQTNIVEMEERKIEEKISVPTKKLELASNFSQFSAWVIDMLLVASFSLVTTILLILVSGMSFQSFLKVIPMLDLTIFSSVLFSIYYLLYFTVLDLSATPGKIIMGIRLVRTNDKSVEVKHTFMRALVSLLSFVALFLPMIIDFQGKLSDTKVVK